MTKVSAIKCDKCEDMIYSRTRHDFRWCSCERIAIDGGFDYMKIAGHWDGKSYELEIDASEKELYDDWSTRADKYGLIKSEPS